MLKPLVTVVHQLKKWLDGHLPFLTPRRRGGLHHLLLAVVLVALALAVRFAIAPVDAGLQYVVFFPAVTLAALAGGFKPGLLAALIGAFFATYFFTFPYYSISVEAWQQALGGNLLFLMDGLVVSISIEAMHRYRKQLAEDLEKSIDTNKVLEESTQHLKNIIDNQFALVAWLDTHGVILEANQASLDWSGYRREEVINHYFYDLPCWSYDETVQAQLKAAMDAALQGQTGRYDATVKIGDDFFVVDFQISPVRNQEGRIVGLLLMAVDISSRIKAEESLKKSQAQLKTFVSQAPIAIAMFDRNMNYLETSEQWLHDFGRGYATLNGLNHYQVYPDLPEKWKQVHQQCLNGALLKNDEDLWIQANGSHCWLHWAVMPWLDEHGAIGGLIMSAEDITERKRNEKRLIESQRENTFLADLIRTSEQAMAVGYPDGRIGLVNTAFEALTGYSAEELQGINWATVLTPPEWLEVENEKLSELALTGQPIRYEKEYLRKNGTRVPIELLVHLKTDVEGQPEFYYAFITDITERRKAKEKLRRLNRTLQALSKSGRALIYAADETAYLQEICRIIVEDCGHAMAWIGFAESDAMKTVRPVASAGFEEGYLDTLHISWADTERGRGPTGTSIRTGQVSQCRNMLTDPQFAPWYAEAVKRGYASSAVFPLLIDGQAIGALSLYSREPDGFPDDEVQLLNELAEDLAFGITTLRLRAAHTVAERGLRENEQRMRLATETTCVGIWEWNFITNQIHWDAQMFRIYGVTPTTDGFVPYTTWSGAVVPEDFPHQEQEMQKSIHLRKDNCREFRIRRADDGQCRYIQAVETVRTNAQGQAEWLVGTNLDVTERKQAEQALKDAARRKDEFLAMLAHELRNPLAPISNAVEILKLTELEPAQIARCTGMINRQVKHLARLVDDLLDVSRISRGLVELKKEPLEIRDFILPAVETCQPLIDTRRHTFSLALPPGPVWVEGDRIRLAQVVSNLINNAAKYTEEGGRIGLSVEALGREVGIHVSDNGSGIDPADLAHLFDLFYQADRNIDRSQGGLGIGLSLVHNLVAQHGGNIHAFSAGRGQGSEFVVRLPRLIHSSSIPAITAAPAVPSANKRRILVVDDNRDVAESLAMLLESEGHQVLTAFDGIAAMETARTERPDIILMDIGLPGMDGYAVAQALRQNHELERTMLIALTGYGQPDDRKKSSASGFDEHLVKPVDIEKLRQLLANYPTTRFS
jgi:PAS domain S-box-containing protein